MRAVAIWLVAGFAVGLALGVKLWIEVSGAAAPHPGGWPEWVTAIATGILALAAVAALAVAIDSLGDARATRHGHMVTDLSARWDAPAMHRSMQLFTFTGSTRIVELFERLYPTGGQNPHLGRMFVCSTDSAFSPT